MLVLQQVHAIQYSLYTIYIQYIPCTGRTQLHNTRITSAPTSAVACTIHNTDKYHRWVPLWDWGWTRQGLVCRELWSGPRSISLSPGSSGWVWCCPVPQIRVLWVRVQVRVRVLRVRVLGDPHSLVELSCRPVEGWGCSRAGLSLSIFTLGLDPGPGVPGAGPPGAGPPGAGPGAPGPVDFSAGLGEMCVPSK